MIIVLKKDVAQEEVDHIMEKIKDLGLKAHYSKGDDTSIIGVIGDESKLLDQPLNALAGVQKVMPVMKPYKMASKEFKAKSTVIDVNGVKIGGGTYSIFAGPCTVENREDLLKIAREVKKRGATFLRGGAFKPRTSPYAFQGLGEEGLKILKEAREETGLSICTEIMDVRDVELISKYADILQIGARNTQNFNLLKEVGNSDKPILLKRGFSVTIEELLMSAEYILANGNTNVILCERGIRTFETATRNTLDLSIVPVIRELSHLPVIIDPSHGVGKNTYVPDMSLASIAVGADGVMLETHYDPQIAKVDASQTIDLETFEYIVEKSRKIGDVVGRVLN